jgi:MATE family multidrug resistance protein
MEHAHHTGQAYGAGDYMLVGETLQRAVLICWAVCVPVALLWSRAGVLMLALHQEPAIVQGALSYLRIVSPSLLFSAVSNNINK